MASKEENDAPKQQEASRSSDAIIRSLEAAFRENNIKNANNLVELISLVKPASALTPKAIHAARRTLTSLQRLANADDTFRYWIQNQSDLYVDALTSVIKADLDESSTDAAVAAAALTSNEVWQSIIEFCFKQGANRAVQLITESFLSRFSDLRCVALKVVSDQAITIDNCLQILKCCVNAEDDHARTKVDQRQMRKAFTSAWMSVLRSEELTLPQRREILARIPTEVIPHVSDPLRLADFISDSYNASDISIAISSLDALFVLISRHGYDYPLFYPKLYALMTEDVLFHCSARHRFLELTAMCLLKGAMLTGGMVAAFIKRLVRRAVRAPTASALWCLRLALDLLRKHPNTSYLVHRSVNLFETAQVGAKRKREAENGSSDPFDDSEMDPQASRADESSLWELEILKSHASPAVSRLVLLFSKDVRKRNAPPPGDLSDFAQLHFRDMFETELKKTKSSHTAYDVPGTAPSVVELRNDSAILWS